jgi:hypothetical protein
MFRIRGKFILYAHVPTENEVRMELVEDVLFERFPCVFGEADLSQETHE